MNAAGSNYVEGVPPTTHPLYWTWYGMLSRCEKAAHVAYPYYGGRGIKVCSRWRSSFAAFVADVGPKPSADHTLDRRDNDGDYEPSNVGWATHQEQGRNRRRVHTTPILLRETCAGQALFREWAALNGLTQKAMGEIFFVAGPCVWAWLAGKNRPDHHYRVAIDRIAGIPSDSWMTSAEYALAYGRAPSS